MIAPAPQPLNQQAQHSSARLAAPVPLVVVWRVLDHCNLECPFCAYDSRLVFPRRVADTQTVEHMIDLLGAWSVATGRPVLLSWLGGEPTLWKPLEPLSRRARSRGLALSLTTNGTTLGSPTIRRLLFELFTEITVSIDGFADVHDEMRGWAGAFEKLKRNVSRLAAEKRASGSHMTLRSNTVLMRRNIDRFADLCVELAHWGVEEMTFNQLGGRDRPEFYAANRLTLPNVMELRGLLPTLRQRLAPFGAQVRGGTVYIDRIAETAEDVALPISTCRVADGFLFIDEAGVVAPCNFVGRHFGATVEDLRTLEALDSIAERLNSHQRCAPSPACANCMSTQQFAKFDA